MASMPASDLLHHLRPLFHKVLVFAIADQFTILVMDGELQANDAGGSPRLQLAHFEQRIERVATVDRLQKTRRLLQEADQRIADDMRKDAGARSALDRHLQAVGQQVAMAARPAVLAVVMDRMIVAARELKGGE